ncbi:hypothetical protein LOK49_LG11G02742 [Camellia lanceoleosa]|uniref:Uncharacterized protein n=1 Tax=Camellia lanceoleosa TaxID=1840588 RepID=A0ACC0G0P4_9ERIC|nr:hypothetical protein LOK49_LG11G02742 [Camellia lanceoleosa]
MLTNPLSKKSETLEASVHQEGFDHAALEGGVREATVVGGNRATKTRESTRLKIKYTILRKGSKEEEKKRPSTAASASILEEEAETIPQAEASSRGEGDVEKPSTGLRSCEAETKQLPWASQSQ